jgi:phosphatidylglycerophosphatase C|tara:strand:- start:1331 stop:1984 length:654 start_codon:yes stop_codon:yes gene_type:complete
LSIQALYDFDGTITSKDTTIILLAALFKLRPWRFLGLIWFLFRMIVASDNHSKQEHKNKAIGYLIKDLSDMHLSGALKDFKNKVKFLYRPSVLASIDKAIEDGCEVMIVTASPSFAISYCVSDLPVIVIGTEFEKEENIYTGLLKSQNCYGPEKVNRINEWATSSKITLRVQSAWSDNFSDFDMLSLSAKRYWIGGEQLRKLVTDRDPEANFVHTDK